MQTVTFHPLERTVQVPQGTSLLEAALKAQISLNNLCGGDGICGRCRMIVKKGEVSGEISGKLTRQEIRKGYVLACMSYVQTDLDIEIPEETLAKEKVLADKDADRFRSFEEHIDYRKEYTPSPLITKIYLELEEPDLANNTADHQRLCEAIRKKLKYRSMQMGLKIIKTLPSILRDNDYRITATVGLRKDITEVMNVEGGDTSGSNYMIVVDVGTTTIVAHLLDANTASTVDADACFNSQGIYGREVTGRMISAEKRGIEELQRILVTDINMLITRLAELNDIHLKDITAVICAGNTAMSHFLVGLPTPNIRRNPYVPVSVELPPLRAAEVGIKINPRGLLYSLPGISGWIGSDITAGILATGMHEKEDLSMLVDIGTNGEIVVGNDEWLVACSASAGPALEGAGEECGMRAEKGAIEKVYSEDGEIRYQTIGNSAPKGICGSGIIDMVSVLLDQGIIDRSGKIVLQDSDRVNTVDGVRRFILVSEKESPNKRSIYLTESDIENIITAKAAIFAAIKILLNRLDLEFEDIQHLYIAGAFGNYIDVNNAVNIGLIPNIPRDRIEFVGNTSIKGAKIAAFFKEAFYKIIKIEKDTTHYDLMGADDYVDEFKKALFLPHTDIELFPRRKSCRKV
jgi:uncharacterized 2Fe-2S/4Fe-4S cluster protein (DUF4445 family)